MLLILDHDSRLETPLIPHNRQLSFFNYLFGMKDYTDESLIYIPVKSYLSIEGETFMLSWIYSVLILRWAFKLGFLLAGALPTIVILDAILAAVFKATRKLAIVHKKLRV